MKLAHFSDLHFCPAHLAEAERCFGYAVEHAIETGVQAAVISGDSTDHALDMHAPAAEALARHVRRLAEHCPVLMLQGTFSHEPPGTLNLFRLLGGRYPVHVSERIEQVALAADGTWIPSKGWRFESLPEGAAVLFSCVPTINKAAVAAAVGATEAASALGEQIALLLRGFAPINRAARGAGVPTLGVSHGTVYGCVSERGVPMAGFDHEFTTAALFAAETSAFLLGHIHKHQSWEQDGQIIAYPGSIGRLHYGEQGDKGFLLWDIGAEAACFELVPTPAKRTVEISFEGRPDLEVLRAQADQADIKGAFVRVRWSLPEEDRHEVDRKAIEAILAGAAQVKLEGRVIPVVRTCAAGIAQAATVAAKIEAWAQATQADPAPLLACLEALHCAAPEDIASGILRGSDIGEAAGAEGNGMATAADEASGHSESLALF